MASEPGLTDSVAKDLVMYSLSKALWEVLGEGAYSTTILIGKEVLELGLKTVNVVEIPGNDPQTLLNGFKDVIHKIVVETAKMAKDFDFDIDGNLITLKMEGCSLMPIRDRLNNAGLTPFICPFMNSIRYGLKKQANQNATMKNFEFNGDTCIITLDMR